jgi:hypothetical protein
VPHLLNGDALEKYGKRPQTLVIQVEVKVHVLMHGREFVGNGVVQQLDALGFVHRRPRNRPTIAVLLC